MQAHRRGGRRHSGVDWGGTAARTPAHGSLDGADGRLKLGRVQCAQSNSGKRHPVCLRLQSSARHRVLRRGITADTALRLSRYFGTTPEVWLRLQLTYDLRKAKLTSGARSAATVRSRAA